jgi:hypothetical protein
MIKKYLQTIVAVGLLSVTLMSVAQASETRCGWLENPTPGNWWLTDADGSWIMSAQGGEEFLDDKSWEKVPELDGKYSCACLTVDVDNENSRIVKIYSGKSLPLKKCTTDPALPKQE